MTAVDLKQLAIDRSSHSKPIARRRRPWVTRVVIPLALVIGFGAVLGMTLRDELLPGTPVTVLPVIATRAAVERSNTPLFHAAGWIEPRPAPTMVTSLVEGVVERVAVVEGQEVAAGQPVAYLIRKDFELAMKQAEVEVQLRSAEFAVAEAQLESAKAHYNEPIQRQAEVAEAEAALAKLETEVRRIPSALRAAEAKARQARTEFEGRTQSKDAIARITVDRAKAELEIALAAVDELTEQRKSLEAERVALAQRRDALKRLLELKIDEKRLLAEAEANLKGAAAKRLQSQISVEVAAIRLERSTITTPVAGKILEVVARPGSRLMGLERAAMLDASTVITLYDPAQLQVRADVRLEDLTHVSIGQSVLIETSAVTGTLTGRVISTTSTADIQKNTLQVKIAIDKPPAMLRPEMLVHATFLSPPSPESKATSENELRLMVPRSVIESVDKQSTVWLVAPDTQLATQRIIVMGQAVQGELVEVTSGLQIGDRLIVNGRSALREGSRLLITGEDRTLGREQVSNKTPR